MKVLIACEESQTVCKAFRELGHEAYSCDLQKCSGGHPEWHIRGDARQLLGDDWDLIIAHPPCTYLTASGAARIFRDVKQEFPPYGEFQMVNVSRMLKGMEAKDFFMEFIHAPCKHVAIENPVPMKLFNLPPPTQMIQPHYFGDPYSKKTCLWLKGLPPLMPTELLEEYHPLINGGGGRLSRETYEGRRFASGSKARSKTFPGIAKAMAEQWSRFLETR